MHPAAAQPQTARFAARRLRGAARFPRIDATGRPGRQTNAPIADNPAHRRSVQPHHAAKRCCFAPVANSLPLAQAAAGYRRRVHKCRHGLVRQPARARAEWRIRRPAVRAGHRASIARGGELEKRCPAEAIHSGRFAAAARRSISGTPRNGNSGLGRPIRRLNPPHKISSGSVAISMRPGLLTCPKR